MARPARLRRAPPAPGRCPLAHPRTLIARALPLLLVALTAAAATAVSCGVAVSGRGARAGVLRDGGVDPGFVRGTDGGADDRLAATAVRDVSDFWAHAFPGVFGPAWTPLTGAYSVDTADPAAAPPPCLTGAADLEGNAQYCPSADAVSWDRAALLPVLRDRYGDAGVVVVIAHELGHAVQHRTGYDVAAHPAAQAETMADCYAGAFLRWAADGHAPHLRITPGDLDGAVAALVGFRDPVGTGAADGTAHGDAFDRAAAVQDGYQGGAAGCGSTGVPVASAGAVAGGNLGVADAVTRGGALDGYFAGVAGAPWSHLAVGGQVSCPGDQGPVGYCAAGIAVHPTELSEVDDELGAQAVVTALASRYGLAVLAARGQPTTGVAAGRAAVCLAGAATGAALRGESGLALAPGGLDAAVRLVLTSDAVSRDGAGAVAEPSGFARFAVFRAGFSDGATACAR